MALQSVQARCRAEADAAVAAAVAAAADTAAAAADALVVAAETAAVVVAAVEGVWREARAMAKKAKQVADRAACSTPSMNQQLEVCPSLARLPHILSIC